MQKKIAFIAVAATLGLAACEGTDLERGAIGAVAGGAIASATDNDIASGVAIGAAAGVFCDDVTTVCR